MAVMRDRPYSNYNFLIEIGGVEAQGLEAGFSEVVLPDAFIDVIEYRNGNDRHSGTRKIPGRVHYGNFILKRGVIGSLDLYEWWNQVRNGDPNSRRTVIIQLQNEDRSAVVMEWKLADAWPVRFTFSPLQAKGKEKHIEMLEIAFEMMEVR